MAKINSVTVAASTYGTLPRVNNWIQSVWNNLEAEIVPKVLVVDDGTPNIDAVKKRAKERGLDYQKFIRIALEHLVQKAS